MPIATFDKLMADAQRGGYAVGYFESWNLESLSAVADAAEARKSPVILGFSGINVPDANRVVREHLTDYAALGLSVCNRLSTPAALIFNESADMLWLREAVDLGFQIVMFADEGASKAEQVRTVRELVECAHAGSSAVEGELASPPGLHGDRTEASGGTMTDLDEARTFVEETGVDALSVNLGQEHLHGRAETSIDLDHLGRLLDALDVPLVLHGATSIPADQIRQAVAMGLRKVNVGSVLRQAYFDNLRESCRNVSEPYNPYEAIGSGLEADVLVAGRKAMQAEVERLMDVFGSSGQA